jgi:hypothetical protein
MSDEIEYKIERPGCGHMATIMARPQQNISDYTHRLVPELREAIQNTPCSVCEEMKNENQPAKENTKAAN